MPRSIEEMCTVPTKDQKTGETYNKLYKAYAIPYADVLLTLNRNDGVIAEKSGLATSALRSACRTKKMRTMGAGVSGVVNKLVDAGWVGVTRNGKRTFRIELLHPIPLDTAKWLEGAPLADEDTDDSKTETAGPPAEPTEAAAPVVAPAPTATEPVSDEDDSGGRPGRTAARLEKSLPELVVGAVKEFMQDERDKQFAALGYWPTVPPDEYEHMQQATHRHDAQVAQLQSIIDDLNEEHRKLGVAFDLMSAEIDDQRVRQNDYTPAMKGSLSVAKIKDPFKGLARLALAQGWTIKTTRGGHLAWRSPEGKTVFSGSTSSDSNSHYIMRRKLRNKGLKIEGGTEEVADEDRFNRH